MLDVGFGFKLDFSSENNVSLTKEFLEFKKPLVKPAFSRKQKKKTILEMNLASLRERPVSF